MTLTVFALAMVFTLSVATLLSLHRESQSKIAVKAKNTHYFRA